MYGFQVSVVVGSCAVDRAVTLTAHGDAVGECGEVVVAAEAWVDVNGVRRHRLEATTKTDAIAELRALQVDFARGEQHRSTGLNVNDLAADWIAHLTARIGHRDPRRRYSKRTVDLYRQRLQQHIQPELGTSPVSDITLADVRRLVDKLGAAGLAPSTVTGIVGILSGLLRFAVKSGNSSATRYGILTATTAPESPASPNPAT
jgi:hypothetical protein